jgi:hypothetical protein
MSFRQVFFRLLCKNPDTGRLAVEGTLVDTADDVDEDMLIYEKRTFKMSRPFQGLLKLATLEYAWSAIKSPASPITFFFRCLVLVLRIGIGRRNYVPFRAKTLMCSFPLMSCSLTRSVPLLQQPQQQQPQQQQPQQP